MARTTFVPHSINNNNSTEEDHRGDYNSNHSPGVGGGGGSSERSDNSSNNNNNNNNNSNNNNNGSRSPGAQTRRKPRKGIAHGISKSLTKVKHAMRDSAISSYGEDALSSSGRSVKSGRSAKSGRSVKSVKSGGKSRNTTTTTSNYSPRPPNSAVVALTSTPRRSTDTDYRRPTEESDGSAAAAVEAAISWGDDVVGLGGTTVGGNTNNNNNAPGYTHATNNNNGQGRYQHHQQQQHHTAMLAMNQDLMACIDVIESINSLHGLTFEQRAAIRNLRGAAYWGDNNNNSHYHHLERRASGRSISRRDAKFYGRSFHRQESPLLTEELLQCFAEVEKNTEDTDQQSNVTAVLANFGGQVFSTVSSIAPRNILGSTSNENISHIHGSTSSSGALASPNSNNVRLSTLTEINKSSSRASMTSIDGSLGSLNLEMLEAEMSHMLDDIPLPTEKNNAPPRRDAAVGIAPLRLNTDSLSECLFKSESNVEMRGTKVYCPPEWNALTKDARTKLTKLLSWERLSSWEFNILEVARLSGETMRSNSQMICFGEKGERQLCPLLFVGWAILCAPMAQQAMEGSLGDLNVSEENEEDEDEEEDDISPHDIFHRESCVHNHRELGNTDHSTGNRNQDAFHYNFSDDLIIDPEKICNFLRQIELRYKPENPYHNNTHAADVTQTLHCFLQFIGEDKLPVIYDSVQIFGILLAATFHDVGHGGKNNMFEQHARTPLAIRYNDMSILENMHSYVGHSFLMGEDKRDEWDVFRDWTSEQIDRARGVMMKGVLGTDMSNHFQTMGTLAGLVEKVATNDRTVQSIQMKRASAQSIGSELTVDDDDEEDNEQQQQPKERPILDILKEAHEAGLGEAEENSPSKKDCLLLGELILKFLLHGADISNPTKQQKLCVFWAECALKEFFEQGEEEERLGIPISPLCDRRTVKKADSQIGFLKFVVKPTYALLGEILPAVRDEVMPIIDANIAYWTGEKADQDMFVATNAMKMASNLAAKKRAAQKKTKEDSEDQLNSNKSLEKNNNNADTNKGDDPQDKALRKESQRRSVKF